jgi:hypothetical protein
MSDFLQRYRWFLLLAVLLVLNGIRYWPVKHVASIPAGPAAMGAGGWQAAIQARVDALPPDQKPAIEERIQQEKDFFVSLQNLPPEDRMSQMMQHFRDNPLPAVLQPPAAGQNGGAQGGFGTDGVPTIQPPEVRRGLEKMFANMIRNTTNQ